MGWVNSDHPEHEGWIVGFTPREGYADGWACRDCDWLGDAYNVEHKRVGRRRKGSPVVGVSPRTCSGEVYARHGASLRELHSPVDKADQPLEWIAAGCECGWRSPRFRAKPWWHVWKRPTEIAGRIVLLTSSKPDAKTDKLVTERPRWTPFVCTVDDSDEERARAIWRQHLIHHAAAEALQAPRGRKAQEGACG